MTNSLAKSTVETFLEKVGGDYVAAYNEILAEENDKALALRPRSNVEVRRKAYLKAIAKNDRGQLRSLQKTLSKFLTLADEVSPIFDNTGTLEPEESESLMVLVLEAKRIKELAESQIAATRERVFNAITEDMAALGEDFPEYVAGYVEVPNLGLKFTREGGNRRDPVLDEDKLAALVGPEVWERVTTTEVIPAQEVHAFDPDLFLQAARTNPELLEHLRSALTPGDFGTRSFHQRPLEQEDTPEE